MIIDIQIDDKINVKSVQYLTSDWSSLSRSTPTVDCCRYQDHENTANTGNCDSLDNDKNHN